MAEPTTTDAEPLKMTLNRALETAAVQDPNGAAADARIDKAQGEYRQTRLWPNPQLEIGAEGVTPDGERSSGKGGAGEAQRPDQQQALVAVKQPLPIAGGRTKLRQAAQQEVQYRKHMREVIRLDVRTQVKKAFLEVLFKQQTLLTLQEMAQRLQQIVTITKARVDGGDIAESELLRAEANHSRLLLDVTTTEEELATARIALAQTMGHPDLNVGECQGSLEISPPRIDWLGIEGQIAANPRTAALEARKEKAELDLRAEKTKRIPSPFFGVGYRHYRQTGQDTVDVSLGIELPLFNRRQGHVAAAQANLREIEALNRFETNSLRATALTIKKRHEYLARKLDEFKNSILPKMTECLAVSQSAFDAGGNSMIEVLDAYRALAETRLSYLETNRDHAELLIGLDTLTNREWFKP